MRKLEEKELYYIVGGLDISGAVINSFARGIKVLFDLGRSFGTAIRRLAANSLCPIS